MNYDKIQAFLKKKNTTYLLLLTGLGIILMIVYSSLVAQEDKSSEGTTGFNESALTQGLGTPSGSDFARDIEKRLELIFSAMAGVGDVKVMVTLAQSRELVVAKEVSMTQSSTTEDDGTGGVREISNMTQDTAYVTLGNNPLVLTEKEARVDGVIVVAQGAGDIRIVEAITNATRALLGIDAHRVMVLNMQEQE